LVLSRYELCSGLDKVQAGLTVSADIMVRACARGTDQFGNFFPTFLSESDVLLLAAEIACGGPKYYDGAYYLCGYAVELALKACIARNTRRHDCPDKKTVNDSYSHNLAAIVRVAALAALLEAELNRDPEFARMWSTLQDWSEERRYRLNSRKEARDLYRAVTARQHGVMRWIRQHW
jgi:hypothetical protein